MKNFLNDIKMYYRFALGLKGFLRHRMTLPEAEEMVQRRIAERENNFLRLIKKAIFDYPRSPYLPLLRLAGCEMEDIRSMVQTKGLEGVLRELRASGVYITFEEFKGRQPLERGGKVFHLKPRQFDNPHLRRFYYGSTAGTTGPGTRVEIDLDHMAEISAHLMLEHHIHSTLNTPIGIWFGTLPDPTGVHAILMRSRYGAVPRKWFAPVSDKDIHPALKYRLATWGTLTAGRLFGVPLPGPEPLRLEHAATIARWAADMVAAHGGCYLITHVSQALRISLAAAEDGLDLTHVTLTAGGEPPSPAKVRMITSTGARWVPKYFTIDAGAVGLGCAAPVDGNDLHFLKDSLALIQYPRRVPGSEMMVDAFNLTTLLPSSPKILLNVESDDYGILETRSCGCPLEDYGFTEHLRDIRSFGKLTGEGVTLVGSEMLHILEEVLPNRFGGSPLDYQLLEEEDQQGFTRLSLVVSPKVRIQNEAEILETVTNALNRSSTAAHLAGALWKQAETLKVRRREPIWTARGKFMPLHRIQGAQQGQKKD